jgi:3-oxoacyl-[acyl-carrier protein] reductase
VTGYAALITGASRGIGKGIASALAARGFAIAANELTASRELESTIDELKALGVDAAPAVGDVSDLSQHQSILDAAEHGVGPLTTLVNNAGVSVLQRGDLLDVSPESYDRCQTVNARGTFFLTQACARRLLSRQAPARLHRSIITISSSNSEAVSTARGEYCISKAAAAMISKLFAVRLGGDEIGSYEIRPGLIETPMTAVVKETYENRIRQGLTVIRRMGQPSDIGSIAVALATGQLAFCTGQTLYADGGLTIPRF